MADVEIRPQSSLRRAPVNTDCQLSGARVLTGEPSAQPEGIVIFGAVVFGAVSGPDASAMATYIVPSTATASVGAPLQKIYAIGSNRTGELNKASRKHSRWGERN